MQIALSLNLFDLTTSGKMSLFGVFRSFAFDETVSMVGFKSIIFLFVQISWLHFFFFLLCSSGLMVF